MSRPSLLIKNFGTLILISGSNDYNHCFGDVPGHILHLIQVHPKASKQSVPYSLFNVYEIPELLFQFLFMKLK